MTNAEFYMNLEKLAALTIVVLRDCDCDKSKIRKELWDELCILYTKIEEYV